MMSGIFSSTHDAFPQHDPKRIFDDVHACLVQGPSVDPVIGAPLFIISVPDLVIAQCKAGIVGSFPALNARPPALLDEWLVRIKQELAAHDKAHPECALGAVRGQPDRAPVEQPARA